MFSLFNCMFEEVYKVIVQISNTQRTQLEQYIRAQFFSRKTKTKQDLRLSTMTA